MAWKRLQEQVFRYRGYRGLNRLDRFSIAALGLGGVLLLAGSRYDSDGLTLLGQILVVLGLLILVRHFPGEGG